VLEEVSAIGFGGIVGLKDGVGAKVILGGGLSRNRACRVEGISHTERGSDWRRVDGVCKSKDGPELAEMEEGDHRDAQRWIGGTSASASPGLGGPAVASPLRSGRRIVAQSFSFKCALPTCPARAG
jgi:hypothetical protein